MSRIHPCSDFTKHPCVLKNLLDGVETLFLVESDGKKDGLHRIVMGLIGGRLRVAAHSREKAVEMWLVLPSQRAPELFPVLCGLLNQLDESRDGSPHSAPRSFRSSRKQWSMFLAGKGKLVFGSGFHLHDVVGLSAKSLKEIAPFGLERCGVGKDGDGKGEWRDISQAFECVFEGSARFPIPNIFIEIQVRQGCDNEHVGGKFLQSLGHTSDEFGQLKTGKGARDANEAVHARWVKAAFSRETRQEERADLVCALQVKESV